MRRFAFLDLDGIVNHKTWLRAIADGHEQRPTVRMADRDQAVLINPAKVELLNMLVRPGIEWVLSSTWRGDGSDRARTHVQSVLEQLGWRGQLIGSTPVLRTVPKMVSAHGFQLGQPTRGVEIMVWLESNGFRREQLGKDVRVAILDDDDDIEPLKEHWVAVDDTSGLTEENVLCGLSLLGEVVIVVVELLPRPQSRLRCFKAGSCHLMANGYNEAHLDALHKFAARIGMHRSYFQPHKIAPHYDLTKGRREAAVEAGALEIPARSFLGELRRLRSS